MADSATESEDSGQTPTKVVAPPTKPPPPPPPVFKPSPATDNDTYFDKYFKPLNGDIILSAKLEYEPTDPKVKKVVSKQSKKGKPPPPPVLTKRAVRLYSDEFDQTQLHPGDFILRRGMFELQTKPSPGNHHTIHEWCWKDLEMATIHVYWPNYHSKGNWFKVARFPLVYCLGAILDLDPFQTRRDFKEEDPNLKESTGDIIIRRLKIQDPTRPWGCTFDPWQLQEYWDEKNLLSGDIVVQACGKYFPPFSGRVEEKEPSFKLKEGLFRVEVDCAWRDPETKKWFYGGQDVFCYKVNVNDPCITQERFRAVPKPGDILITQGDNLLRPVCDRNYSKGGYVQMYNDKRFFYPGDPPLRPVNVNGPGNIAIRFGHFNHDWQWTPHPCLQLFHFHERECAWYTLGPVLLTYKWMVAPDDRFEQRPLELNSVVPNLVPKEGDIIIRKPRPPPPKLPNPLVEKETLRTSSYFEENPSAPKSDPFWERIMKIVPYSAQAIRKSPLVQGDCLLRTGIEPAGPLSTAKYNATAELYMLVLDHWDRLVWIFRGYDKVFFGGPQVEPHYQDELPEYEGTRSEVVVQKRDLSTPSPIPQLVSTQLRPSSSSSSKRKVDDVLIERSVWNNPGYANGFSWRIQEENRTNEKPKSKGKEGEDKDEKSKRKESKSRAGHDKNDSRINKEAEAKTVTPGHREEQKVPLPENNKKQSTVQFDVSTKFSHEVIENEFAQDEHKTLNKQKSNESLGAQSPKAEEGKTTDNTENRTSLLVHHGSGTTTSGVEAEEDSKSFKTEYKAEVKTEKVETNRSSKKMESRTEFTVISKRTTTVIEETRTEEVTQ
ncbi:hypothetical protein R1sor_011250 [Riccia sorocarpa]|uniref:Uncharacterized protein n=1 Tax=Riccia sorocarpa TaxID=122646 RepID=A0ABD3I6D9_9MARC